jgi:beta-lactamase class A
MPRALVGLPRALVGLIAASMTSFGGASAASTQPAKPQAGDSALSQRLATIARSAGGTVGVAAIHVETGRTIEVQGRRPLPLYSVFKLPLAVVVLKAIEEGRLKLDQKVRVSAPEIVPGSAENATLWPGPMERTLRELLELSIVRSDNTSADKLLELGGGPGAVTRKLTAMGIPGITIRRSVHELLSVRTARHPNTASALDLAHLLARLQKGEILRPDSRELLFDFMAKATTGLHRLRGGLPEGTPVGDKTGSGPSSTNDVGVITLPDGKGHVAMAVLVSGSKRPVEAQEKAIADLARAVYEANVSAR